MENVKEADLKYIESLEYIVKELKYKSVEMRRKVIEEGDGRFRKWHMVELIEMHSPEFARHLKVSYEKSCEDFQEEPWEEGYTRLLSFLENELNSLRRVSGSSKSSSFKLASNEIKLDSVVVAFGFNQFYAMDKEMNFQLVCAEKGTSTLFKTITNKLMTVMPTHRCSTIYPIAPRLLILALNPFAYFKIILRKDCSAAVVDCYISIFNKGENIQTLMLPTPTTGCLITKSYFRTLEVFTSTQFTISQAYLEVETRPGSGLAQLFFLKDLFNFRKLVAGGRTDYFTVVDCTQISESSDQPLQVHREVDGVVQGIDTMTEGETGIVIVGVKRKGVRVYHTRVDDQTVNLVRKWEVQDEIQSCGLFRQTFHGARAMVYALGRNGVVEWDYNEEETPLGSLGKSEETCMDGETCVYSGFVAQSNRVWKICVNQRRLETMVSVYDLQ